MASCEIVDMRLELRRGNNSIISNRLHELIEDRLSRHEQVMLFLNRRGMLGSLSCRECGETLKCPHCDVSLSLHGDKKMHCHYCGYTIIKPTSCGKCGSKAIGGFSIGTEKVEELVAKEFPSATVLRMDMDTTKGKSGHEAVLEKFANREADILVGTQMIVKGHDFSNVTLVGALAADMSLNVPDYRSGERTFQLLTQAVGRAGRGEKPGNEIIQTYQPENYSIVSSMKQDYE
jgi:primosomal protein N' (replication factor Y)